MLKFTDSYKDKGSNFLKALISKAAQNNQLAQGSPVIGQFLSKAGPLYFSAVRNQIVCIDDVERRGAGLELRMSSDQYLFYVSKEHVRSSSRLTIRPGLADCRELGQLRG